MDLVLVGDIPGSRRASFVVSLGLGWCRILGLLCVEGIAVEVLLGTRLARPSSGVDLEDGVLLAVDIRVDS